MSIVKWELISTDAEYSWRKNTGLSTLQLGTTSTTALAGNTPTITSTQAALITTNQTGVATNLSATESNNNNIVANRNTGIMNTRFRDENKSVIASHTSTLSNYGSSIIANSNSITNLTNSDETNTSAIATNTSGRTTNTAIISGLITKTNTLATNVNENTGDIISANANISQLISAISTNTSGRTTNASNITANLSAINNLAGTYIIFRADTTAPIYTDTNFQFWWDGANKQLMFQMLTAPGIGAWIDGGMSITGTGVHLGVGDDLTSALNSNRYFTGTNVTSANVSFSPPTFGSRMDYFLCPEGNNATYPTYEMTIFMGSNSQTAARLLVRRYPS
jgi:hypothetical protein